MTFIVRKVHLPTGKEFTEEFKADSRLQLLEYMNLWNYNSDWKYTVNLGHAGFEHPIVNK